MWMTAEDRRRELRVSVFFTAAIIVLMMATAWALCRIVEANAMLREAQAEADAAHADLVTFSR